MKYACISVKCGPGPVAAYDDGSGQLTFFVGDYVQDAPKGSVLFTINEGYTSLILSDVESKAEDGNIPGEIPSKA